MAENNNKTVVTLDFLQNAFNTFSAGVKEVITKDKEQINTNKTNIDKNTKQINTNKTNIDKNTKQISANTTNIEANTKQINTNKTNIEANTKQIGTNTTNIATNATAISTINNTINTEKRENIVIKLSTNSGAWVLNNNTGEYTCSFNNSQFSTSNDYIADIFIPGDKIEDKTYKEEILEEWSKISHIQVSNGSVKIYAFEIPEKEVQIKLKPLF